ncbi:interleukin-12 subunit beta [Heteronotia binoei]|uniref:interleukin-12 subunit beta n=1 Tax=Heteronotia binoei TaxID=13085 RepID=UPI00292F90ED|nr:interleukin-12 subunit beta [Heteronotia binoei]
MHDASMSCPVYIIDSWWTSESPPEEVHLHCNVSGKHNASVYWKKDNKIGSRDASWKIKVKEPRDAGNFTCWSSSTNELLNYATLYIAKINQEGRIKHQILNSEGSSNSNFKCTANNYSGNFTCSWMIAPQSQNQNLKFAVRSLNSDNTSGSVTCEEPIRDFAKPGRYSVSCKKEKPCLSAEEYQQIELGLDVFDKHIYENATLGFFIKDICE